jgi:hypothetical protein
MYRNIVCLSALTGLLLLGTHAHAEEPDLQSRLLITTWAFSSLYTGVDAPTPGLDDKAGSVYPSANLGFRVGIGQGKWSSDPRVFLGHMANGGDFVSGYTVGFWGRSGSPSPSIDERYGAAYGLSFTHFSQTEKGRMVANTFEGGTRFSVNDSGAYTTPGASPLGQAVLVLTSQSLLMDNVLVGPSLEVRVGNDDVPWSGQVGIRLSI